MAFRDADLYATVQQRAVDAAVRLPEPCRVEGEKGIGDSVTHQRFEHARIIDLAPQPGLLTLL